MSTLIFKKEKPEDFLRLWNQLGMLCKVGPRLTEKGMEYTYALAEERGLEDDYSFIMLRGDTPIAGALLPIGTLEGTRAITMGGDYVDVPLVVDSSIRKEVFRVIDEQANIAGVSKALFMIDPLLHEPYNYLQEFGFLDSSTLSYIYDLTQSDDLLLHLRRNHARSLKEILQDSRFEVVRIDAEHPSREHHEKYERLHERCAGRKTRSSKTFNLQYEQLLAGEAVLFAVLMEESPVAYGYFWHAHGKVLYASVADDPDVTGFPLNHLLTFSGMHYYKERGFTELMPGEPSSPSPQFDYFPNAKQLHISHFKTGFSGSFRPFHRGIRYYTADAIASDADRFGKKYVEALDAYERDREKRQ